MGRRSINTTKSGKYMNPTDQARKEARKKELKKNKRQRQMVRAAVLKGKDPSQILEEMEKIDEMEYNVFQPSPLNEKVLREKRKKLKETFDRVMRLYHNDDPELWAELKRKEVEYEKKRLKKQQYYESVKSAQSVQIDEIPLPQMNLPPPTGSTQNTNRAPPLNSVNFPLFVPGPQQARLKDHHQQYEEKSVEKKKKEIPGCPPGPPPDLTGFSDLNSDAEDNEIIQKRSTIKSKDKEDNREDNIDKFMIEMENMHNKKKKSQQENKKEDTENSDISDHSDYDRNNDDSNSESDQGSDIDGAEIKESNNISIPLPPIPPPPPGRNLPGRPPVPPMGHPHMMFRPPPLRPGIPGIGIRMPPGPPPGRPGMQNAPRLGLRMPPGPPPGMPPPRMMHHQKGHHQHQPNKLDSKGITTITAKPQIRNLSADVTRFVPSTLRIKKDDKKNTIQQKRPKPYQQELRNYDTSGKSGAAKDDAYMQFMKEMQGLL